MFNQKQSKVKMSLPDTYKSGAMYEYDNPKNILFKNSIQEKEKEKERNLLLKEVGDDLTPAQTLYSSTNELKKIKEEKAKPNFTSKPKEELSIKERLYGKSKVDGVETGGASKIKNPKNPGLGTGLTQTGIGKNYGKFPHSIAKKVFGKDTAGMLDLAHGDKMNEKDYIKDAIKLKNFDDPAVASDKEYLKKKVSEQFKDYGFDANKIKGYFFKTDSEPSKRVSENKDFHQILKNNTEAILGGKDFSGRFQKHGPVGAFGDNNLKNAIGAADFKHPYLDKEGNLRVKMYDTYDFNKKATDELNQAGRIEMEKGNLKPYFSIHDIIISKDSLDKILK